MSSIGNAISDLLGDSDAVVRSIGGFTANVTIEEDATDELEITRQPVEQGAEITDHAYKQPATLLVRAGWSNSSDEAGGDPTYCASIYQDLLDLQASRELLDVDTGKRSYTNMLIRSLRQVTTEDSENTLLVQFTLQQVILVPTSITSQNQQNQSDAKETGGVNDSGTKQLQNGQNYNGGPI